MKKILLFATCIAISASVFAGERSDLERADLARIEFGDVSGSIQVFEIRNDHFLAQYTKDGVTKLAAFTINGSKSFESDTLNAVGRCPKFDNNALMVRSNKSRINYSYYPYSIVYTTGQIKKLPDTWCDATEFVDGLALVMDKPTNKVFYIDTNGNKVFPHLDWVNKYSNALPEIRPLVDNRRAFRGADGLWGFIDSKGAVVIPAQFANVRDFSDGHAGVTVKMPDGSYKIGFINTAGKFTCQPQFPGSKNYWVSKIGDVNSGIFLVHDDNAYKYYDTNGNLLKKFEDPDGNGIFCRPFVDGYAIVYASEKVNDALKTFMYIIGTDMMPVAQYEDRLGERLVDDGCPVFVKCGSSYLAKNHGAHRIMRPDGTFVIGPAKERGEEGWKPWNDVFGLPQRDGYIFARREIDEEDYYGYVLPNGQFRILFDQNVVYAGATTR